MKGRIMSIENDKFYLITENGEFISTDAAKGFEIGDEVEIKKSMPSYMKPLASIAAAFLIVCSSVYGYHIPVRYVDVCINPEIELSLNIFNRVVKVDAKNNDGKRIVAVQNLKNESVNDAIEDIVDSARSFGFMANGDEGERDVIVSVFGNGAYELSTKIPLDNVRVVDDADCEKAKAENIPVGKYVLINELSKADSNQDKEKAKDLSVKEIIDKINIIKETPKATPTPAPTAVPTPSPTPEPTVTPELTAEPIQTQQPVPVAKSSSKSNKTTKSTAVASKKTSGKTTTVAKVTSGSSSSTFKNNIKTNQQTTSSSNVTTKPTSAPVSVQVSAAPIKQQSATPIPSFDKVNRPSANNSSNNYNSSEKNTEAYTPSDNTVEKAPTSVQSRPSTEQINKNEANSKPSESAPTTNANSTSESTVKNESQPTAQQQHYNNDKSQSSQNSNNRSEENKSPSQAQNSASVPTENKGNSSSQQMPSSNNGNYSQDRPAKTDRNDNQSNDRNKDR